MHGKSENGTFHIPTLAVIGVGLIGGSLALALKRGGHVGRVVGAGRSRANLQTARRLGVIDAVADSPQAAVAGADVVLLAAPVGATEFLLDAIAPALPPAAVVTDVGSVKTWVCEAAEDVLGAGVRRFVPGHPVAGKEHSGVVAARAELFDAHNVALTPLDDTDADALRVVQRMWAAAGAHVITMRPELHDRVLALTSHLPHVLAYAMVDLFADANAGRLDQLLAGFAGDGDGDGEGDAADAKLYGDMAAGGFYDFTRTASSDPEMWRDICMTNRENILHQLMLFIDRVQSFVMLLGANDIEGLERLFEAARNTRARVGDRRKRADKPSKPPES